MMRFVVALVSVLLFSGIAQAQTGTAKSTSALDTEVGNNLPDNTAGQITPFLLRQTLVDIIASYWNFSNSSGDCSITSAGVITCLSSNGVPFAGMAFQSPSNVAITGGFITGMPSPANPPDVATKQYVDNVATGLSVHTAVRLATTTALPANTYSNGSSGVGATLTANSNAALTIDIVDVYVYDRVIVKNETSSPTNGIYVVTATGSGSAEYVLTRATDANTPGTGSATEIGEGSFALVTAGATQVNEGWVVNGPIVAIGPSAITWAQFSATQGGTVTSISTGNGLSGGPITSTGTVTANVDGTTIKDSGGPLVASNVTVAGQTCIPGGVNCPIAAANLSDTVAPTPWTPTDASGASFTLTINNARYYKIGKLVFINYDITYPGNASGLVAVIGGLPFAPSTSTGVFNQTCASYVIGVDTTTNIFSNAASTFEIINASTQQATNAGLSARTIRGSCVYLTN